MAAAPPSHPASASAAAYEAPPGPSLNGGLYTGAPFARGAPWANVPVTPDAGYMSLVNLQTAGVAPDLARHHLPGGGLRPGNNTPLLPRGWTDRRVPHLGMVCVPPEPPGDGTPILAASPPGALASTQRAFRAHAYLPTLSAHEWRACTHSAS